MESRFDDWISSIDWFRPDDIGWVSASCDDLKDIIGIGISNWSRTFGTKTSTLRKMTILWQRLLPCYQPPESKSTPNAYLATWLSRP